MRVTNNGDEDDELGWNKHCLDQGSCSANPVERLVIKRFQKEF